MQIFVISILFILFSFVNIYVANRIHQLFPNINQYVYVGVFLFLFLILVLGFFRSMIPIPLEMKHILKVISSYLLGIYLFLFLFYVISDFFLWFLRFFRFIPEPISFHIYFLRGIAVVFFTFLVVVYSIFHAKDISYQFYDVSLSNQHIKNDIKIVLISDLHLGAVQSEERLSSIIQKINDLQSDFVCISGDLFDNDFSSIQNPDVAIDLFRSIESKYGVYATLGNHDSGKTLSSMKSFLEQSNIHLLQDEYEIIDEQFVLLGRIDSSPIGGYQNLSRKSLDEVLINIDSTLPVIVMDHNPSHVLEYDNRVDLILMGHTHKGQIFPGNIITKFITPVDYGYFRKDSMSPQVIVTSGVGTWGMPMRFGTNNEIVMIHVF